MSAETNDPQSLPPDDPARPPLAATPAFPSDAAPGDAGRPAGSVPPTPPVPPLALAPAALAPPPEVRVPAGFWRRVAAFALDGLVLGLAGSAAGFFWFSWFASLGPAGRLIGFAVSLLYFGLLNSRLGGGQSPGKRILSIEVVALDGRPVTPARSALRFVVLGTPFFLNGMVSSPLWAAAVAGVLIFGLGGATVYLFLFNSRTRRSLHDLVCGTIVVNKRPAGEVVVAPLWRGHRIVVALVLVIALVLPVASWRLAGAWKFPGMLALRTQMLARADVTDAGVFAGKTWQMVTGAGSRETSYLALTVRMKRRPANFEEEARVVARLALATYADAEREDVIVVSVIYGYDIGIARVWFDQRYQHSPAEWAGKTSAD